LSVEGENDQDGADIADMSALCGGLDRPMQHFISVGIDRMAVEPGNVTSIPTTWEAFGILRAKLTMLMSDNCSTIGNEY
jgi:hypothetical protein